MMNKYFITAILSACLIGNLKAQEIYFKPNLQFHFPVTFQTSPEYFEAEAPIPSYFGGTYIPSMWPIEKFSLAKGISLGGALGYGINDKLRIEMGLNYFRSNKKFDNGGGFQSDWNFRTLNLMPVLLLDKHLKNTTFSIKAGGILGLSHLEKTALFGEEIVKTYAFNRNLSVGYLLGFEYQFHISAKTSLVTECGIENFFYTPQSAKLLSTPKGIYPDGKVPLFVKKIEYEKEILNQNGDYDFNSGKLRFFWDDDAPSKRLKETLKLNSIYLGIGLIYKIKHNEEN